MTGGESRPSAESLFAALPPPGPTRVQMPKVGFLLFFKMSASIAIWLIVWSFILWILDVNVHSVYMLLVA